MSKPSIVILTGAGISKESGLDTFRCAGGLWQQVSLEDVATPEGFQRNPALVHEFYNARRAQLRSPEIQPNEAHRALARLEQEFPGTVLLVTQNIDNLHERAGSQSLIHMHGELLKAECEACGAVLPWDGDLSEADVCPSCQGAGLLRPRVVWFGEMPLEMPRIFHALEQCDLFISVGTSGNVYPAAGFVDHVQRCGQGDTVELNLEPSEGASLFDEKRYGPATSIVPAFVEEILSGSYRL
ncbi:Sir2 family NAD+-dependent deacetylase [Insolitispirillum peregrinum]|uniref:Sir2 family NAD+-dependent deacetylase n=1 Tax=Insolitispirillum peregrinum TaxID=80876 RepID=UPI003617C4E6